VIRLDPANGQAYRWRAQAYALSQSGEGGQRL
jgi:hypothetical protein